MIKDVKVIPGCISCRNCESVAPEIFHLNPTSQVISKDFNTNAIKILQAAYMCPAQVIKVDTL
jgi:ferredoxin